MWTIWMPVCCTWADLVVWGLFEEDVLRRRAGLWRVAMRAVAGPAEAFHKWSVCSSTVGVLGLRGLAVGGCLQHLTALRAASRKQQASRRLLCLSCLLPRLDGAREF